jgi:hypothetical protein
MRTNKGRGNTGGIRLVILCVLAITVGRHLYGGLSMAFAEPASSGYGVGSSKGTNSPYSSPRVVGVLEDPSITESSGLVASRTMPGSFWTHNDSGDYEPYLFCVRSDASSCGRWTIPGADASDWEDISWGPGPGGSGNYLYVGDIGDNLRKRSSVQVHVVPEPTADDDADMNSIRATEPQSTIDLIYPDGPHDAETLMVHPTTGAIYIVTKERDSRANVFKASPPLAASMELTKVASFRILDNFSERTGGDISADGSRIVVSTFLGAYEKVAPAGNFDLVWSASAASIDLGVIKQREAIAYGLDGRSIFTTSEGRNSKLVTAVRK